ncbi:polysaccharide biosynthesis protein [Pseudomonas brassicacearum]|uniref:Polysaccharide biosynthesis protein n=1 Tax=Pseudomonas brassicacearum TaxID=930166 RepID=A0A423H5V6_9PSED|nr:oligosaccharide flippase family protein [Pseudomonas brassicacearum]RON08592.1 polysaccharide biosynthesis protein [Pseudomonas brassicacearum]
MNKTTALKAISLLWIGSLAGAGFAFLTQVLLARKLGSNDFGAFSSALTTITLLAPLAGFGISHYWLKAFGQEGWTAKRWLKPSFQFIILSTLLLMCSIAAWALYSSNERLTQNLLLILSLCILGQLSVELVSSKLQLEEKYLHLALWQILPNFLRCSMVFITVVMSSMPLAREYYAVFYSVIAVVFFLLGIPQLLHMINGKLALKGHELTAELTVPSVRPSLLSVAGASWPFGVAVFSQLIYFQSNIILLKHLSSNSAAGIYSVAFTIMTAVYLLPGVMYQRFLLPKMHRWANHDPEMFYQVYRKGNWLMVLLGTLAMLVILVCSDWAVPLLFGEAYREASSVLKILSLSAPVIFLAFSPGATLVTQEHMKVKVKYMALVAIINVFLNLLLIPRFDLHGAAAATVVSNLLLLSLYFYGAQRLVFKNRSR